MPRIRSIKPDTASSASLNRCSIEAELMFIKSWCFFDDTGVHPADPMQLKMRVYPGRDFSEEQILCWIEELIAQDCLALFEVPATDDPELKHFSGRKFWICVNWAHQRIDHPTPPQAPIRRLWLASRGEVDPGDKDFDRPGARQTTPPAPAVGEAALDWTAATARAAEHFRGLGLNEKPQDANVTLKIALLTLQGKLDEDWSRVAAGSLKKARENPKRGKQHRPGALLTDIFKKKCAQCSPPRDFLALLSECPEPPPRTANAAAPPSPGTSAWLAAEEKRLAEEAAAKREPRGPAASASVDAIVAAAVKPPPAPRKKTRAELRREVLALDAATESSKSRPTAAEFEKDRAELKRLLCGDGHVEKREGAP